MRVLILFLASVSCSFGDMVFVGGCVPYRDDARIIVRRASTEEGSWESLANSYEIAKGLTPGGNALSESNRAVVVIPPGTYDAGTNSLVLDTDYVDIVAMCPEVNMAEHRDYTITHDNLIYYGWQTNSFRLPKTLIRGTQLGESGVVVQSAEDVNLEGFGIELYGTSNTNMDGSASAFYCSAPEGGQYSRYEKMTFFSDNTGTTLRGGCMLHVYNFDGEWIDCVANDFAFRLKNDYVNPRGTQEFRATMVNCHAGIRSFGGDSPAGIITNAYFENCTCPGGGFGGCTYEAMPNSASTTFVDCKALPYGRSWGLGDECAGTLIRCEGGILCAGGTTTVAQPGSFTGWAIDCVFGAGSLGGIAKTEIFDPNADTNSFNSGTVDRCIVQGSYYPTKLKGATIRDSYWLQLPDIVVEYVYAEIVGGVTNQVVSSEENIAVDPPWYNLGPVTNIPSAYAFELIDNESKILDSIIEIDSEGDGTAVTAESSQGIVFVNNTFNNSDSSLSGLGSNVTQLAESSGWATPIGTVDRSVNFNEFSATNISSVVFTNGDSISVDEYGLFLNTDYVFDTPKLYNANTDGFADFAGSYARMSSSDQSKWVGYDGTDIKVMSGGVTSLVAAGSSTTIRSGAGGMYLNHDNAYPTRIKNGVLLNDADASDNSITNISSMQFSGGSGDQGTVSWNADEETIDIIQNGSVLQVGQEFQIHAKNDTGSTITNGTVVMFAGTDGASGNIKVAPATTSDAKLIVGVVTYDITNGGVGKVTTAGKVRGLDTSDWDAEDILYYAPGGMMTNVAPTSGLLLPIAAVINSHAQNGTILVRMTPIDESPKMHTKTTSTNYIVGTDNLLEAYGGTIYVTAAVDVTAPAVADGMHFTVITIGANTIDVDVNASDKMWLEGTALDDGDKATSGGATGEKIEFTYYSADGWVAISTSGTWSDGGP